MKPKILISLYFIKNVNLIFFTLEFFFFLVNQEFYFVFFKAVTSLLSHLIEWGKKKKKTAEKFGLGLDPPINLLTSTTGHLLMSTIL